MFFLPATSYRAMWVSQGRSVLRRDILIGNNWSFSFVGQNNRVEILEAFLGMQFQLKQCIIPLHETSPALLRLIEKRCPARFDFILATPNKGIMNMCNNY